LVVFRVLTLNLWNISEPLEPRYRALAAGLAVLRPEIVCLQEVYRDPKSGRSQAALVAEMCRLKHYVGDIGLSIVSAQPVARSVVEDLPQIPDDPPRQVLLAETVVEGRRLLVINTHLAYEPKMSEGRRKQAEVMLAAIKRHNPGPEACPAVLCGDFNDVAESPAVRLILEDENGFRDAFAECQPRDHGFTYSPRNPYVEPSWTENERIDYVFVGPGLTAMTCTVVFDGGNGLDFASDHFGVACDIRFAGRPASAV
jgi:endonuclease/exonuclease/phosphatase family metal-dependent hydrolase